MDKSNPECFFLQLIIIIGMLHSIGIHPARRAQEALLFTGKASVTGYRVSQTEEKDSGKGLVDSSYRIKPRTVSSEVKRRLPSMAADSGGDVHDVLNHRADAGSIVRTMT